MKIHRIVIENFRNFQQLDLVLHNHAVIVGPNNVGKSNLLHGLRLVLDPSLPDTARQLRAEDFWDGLERPLSTDARLRIAVELTDFESNDDQLAALAECLVSVEPMVARLTYVCQRSAHEGASVDDLEFFIFGGDHEERRVGYELRRRLPLDLAGPSGCRGRPRLVAPFPSAPTPGSSMDNCRQCGQEGACGGN
jgi:putative ATP-dependent endonuclease of OLD family